MPQSDVGLPDSNIDDIKGAASIVQGCSIEREKTFNKLPDTQIVSFFRSLVTFRQGLAFPKFYSEANSPWDWFHHHKLPENRYKNYLEWSARYIADLAQDNIISVMMLTLR